MKAFPKGYEQAWMEEHTGMDLRDYFAAKAMQELLNWDLNVPVEAQSGMFWLAEYSYKIADEMMKAREAK